MKTIKKNIILFLGLVFALLFLGSFAVNNAKAAAVCGNKILEVGEQCDDGNTVNGDGCSASCQKIPAGSAICGNSVVEAGEQCDDGNTVNGDGCSASCQAEAAASGGPDVITQLVDVLQILIIGAAFFMFILAIFTYIGSGGDSKKVSKAKEYLVSAITALFALLLARWFFT